MSPCRETGERALPGRGPAFLEKPGEKHQGLRALDPETIAAPKGAIKQLQVGYKCSLLQLLYGKRKKPCPGQVVQ